MSTSGSPDPPSAATPSSAHEPVHIQDVDRSDGHYETKIHRLSTEFVPTKYASIEAGLDKVKGKAMVYLDSLVIRETRLSDWMEEVRDGYYKASAVYLLVDEQLRSLQRYAESKEKANTFFRLPSEASLQKVRVITMTSLASCRAYCLEMADNYAKQAPNHSGQWAYRAAKLHALLLNGEECKIWEWGQVIGIGRLTFRKFSTFSIKEGELRQYFDFRKLEIISKTCRIEMVTEGDYVKV